MPEARAASATTRLRVGFGVEKPLQDLCAAAGSCLRLLSSLRTFSLAPLSFQAFLLMLGVHLGVGLGVGLSGTWGADAAASWSSLFSNGLQCSQGVCIAVAMRHRCGRYAGACAVSMRSQCGSICGWHAAGMRLQCEVSKGETPVAAQLGVSQRKPSTESGKL